MATTKQNNLTPRRSVPSLFGTRDPFLRFRTEMDEMFNHYLSPRLRGADAETEPPLGLPASVDLSETDKAVIVTLDAPGMTEDDIDVTLTDNGLLISGSREQETKDETENYHYIERSYGSFQRLIPLPCEVKSDTVDAELKKGVLTVKLPKSEKAKQASQKIAIKSN